MNSREGAGDTGLEPLPGAAANDDGVARGALFAALYDELHRLARRELARGGAQAMLSPTTLLHEAYLDIVERDGLAFPDRARFMGYAARVMRGLLVDHARNRCAQKRGGLVAITSLRTDVAEQAGIADDELVRVSELLEDLASNDASLAELVDLKFFCGFSVREIAALRGVSERTVQRDWEKARAYLYRGMRPAPAE
jgi:RNA polymerase sigma factor (TIGR02999 family)